MRALRASAPVFVDVIDQLGNGGMTGGKHFLAKGNSATGLTQALTTAFKDIIQEIKSTHLVRQPPGMTRYTFNRAGGEHWNRACH